MKESLTYQQAGVDPQKAGKIIATFSEFLKTRPKDPAIISGIGPFASCLSLKEILTDYRDPVLVTSCDGVGTKAMLAQQWGDLTGIGIDLVAMNVNDLLCVGAKPLLFLDYYACGKLREAELLTLLKSIQQGCELAGCSLVGGETAEMPGLYSERDFDLAGFTVGIIERESILGAHRVKEGDRLLAIESSGIHSNGYSLVRKIIRQEKISPALTAPFEPILWKDILLKPTTIYVRALTPHLKSLHAAAHITGGGLFENLPRVLPSRHKAIVSSSAWPIPPLFQWLQNMAGLSTHDLLSTFNCGVGMIAIGHRETAKNISSSLNSQGLRCWDIGSVEKDLAVSSPIVQWQ